MRIIKKKLNAIADNDSFLTEASLKRDNLILLFSIAVFLFIRPFSLGGWIFAALLSIIVISGITSLKFRIEKFIRLSYFGILTLLAIWINYFIFSLETRIIAFIVLLLFLIYITYSMVNNVARSKKVAPILIFNAINSYLLFGIIAAFLFILSDVVYEFMFGISNGTINFGYTENPTLYDYIYFSFITLTTVGYGDATPAIPLTRSIAVFVSLSAQLYLTILVAMLVGKFLSNKD